MTTATRSFFAGLSLLLGGQFPATAQWVYRPVTSTAQLHGVEFVTPAVGVAVGAGGTLLRSVDGGDTWAAVPSGTTQALKDVAKAPDGALYAAGDAGTLHKSGDQGATWAPLVTGTTRNLNGVHFPSATTGFAAGAGGTLLRTTDGGQTWQALNSGITNTLGGVYFPTPTVGYAVQPASARYLKTVDGGATWAVQALPAAMNASLSGQVVFLTEAVGFLVGGYSLGLDQDFAAIYATTDGGTSWTRRPLDGVLGWSVRFVSPTAGYVLAHGGNLSYPGMEVISHTRDGGATWVTHSFFPPRQPFTQLLDLTFPSLTAGVLVGQQGQVYRNANVVLATAPSVTSRGQLYPNPAARHVTASFAAPQRVLSYALTNAVGQTTTFSPAVTDARAAWQLDLTGLAPGRYYLRLLTPEGPLGWAIEVQ